MITFQHIVCATKKILKTGEKNMSVYFNKKDELKEKAVSHYKVNNPRPR